MTTACGLLLSIALAAAAACNTSNSGSDPRRDLVIGLPEGNVQESGQGAGQFASMLAIEGLTQLAGDGRVLPRLADSWAWELDELRLRVFLKRNVQFHDGTNLTATLAAGILKDVIANPMEGLVSGSK